MWPSSAVRSMSRADVLVEEAQTAQRHLQHLRLVASHDCDVAQLGAAPTQELPEAITRVRAARAGVLRALTRLQP
jgi:hypothetical protein